MSRDLALRALDTANSRGAGYVDVRIVHRMTQDVSVRDRAVEGLTVEETEGFGVRVLVDGRWGFAASHILTAAEADRVAAEAVRIARASARTPGPRVELGEAQRIEATYRTPVLRDPFTVSLDDQIALLLRANEAMLAERGIAVVESNIGMQRERKTFASSEGSYIEQELIET